MDRVPQPGDPDYVGLPADPTVTAPPPATVRPPVPTAGAPALPPPVAGGIPGVENFKLTDPRAYVFYLAQNKPWNQQTLLSMVPDLAKYGIKLAQKNSAGEQTKLILPDGTYVRVGFGEGHPVWIPGAAGGAEGETGAFANGIDPSYLTPFTDKPPTFGGGPGDFQAPTSDDILNDPSYTFRRDQAVDVLGKTRAAQGLYNSGGTISDLAGLASNFAGAEYNNVFNRKFGIWDADWSHALSSNSARLQDYQNARETYFANQSNPFQKLSTIAQLGANTAANAG